MITTDTTSGITHIGRDELQPSKGKQEIRNNVIYGIVIYDNYLIIKVLRFLNVLFLTTPIINVILWLKNKEGKKEFLNCQSPLVTNLNS